MCGRYTLNSTGQVVAELFELDEEPSLAPRYNIAPSQEVAAVRLDRDSGRRVLARVRWGLHPSWSRTPPGSDARMINARAETLADKAAFRDPLRRRRCLLPADGFFEWRKLARRKQPYLIRMDDGRPFAFAGLWDRWRGPEDRPVESCTIVTTGPNDLVATLHDRMPVILAPRDFGLWLDPEVGDSDRLRPLLRPYPAAAMTMYPVSRRVNDPANDDASLLDRDEDPPPQGELFG
jgi:putative SOS response-associated peptidase YedK